MWLIPNSKLRCILIGCFTRGICMAIYSIRKQQGYELQSTFPLTWSWDPKPESPLKKHPKSYYYQVDGTEKTLPVLQFVIRSCLIDSMLHAASDRRAYLALSRLPARTYVRCPPTLNTSNVDNTNNSINPNLSSMLDARSRCLIGQWPSSA